MSLLITLPVVSANRSAPVVLKEPQVLAAPAVPSHAVFETCGRAFHVAALGADAVHDATTEVEITAGGLNLKDEKWEILRNKKIDLEDYYGLLGLEDKSWRATTDEIKNAFRIVSLVCHPDKAALDNREYAEARFKALQKGHEILTDPTKRRGYDSSLPFDDSLPTDKQGLTEKDFFKVYEPVFARNERFSTVQPCPALGDMDTPDDQVFEFYDFWFNFKSWREYAHLDEHKINDGTGREEKRWMLRENQKKQAGKKKEELARIRKLAEDAQKKDPRIARFRKREEEEKLKKKMAKTEGARAQAEAAAKAKAEEEARLAEEKRQKEEQENREREQKKQLKSVRSYFGKFCREAGQSEEDIEKLKGVLSFDQFNEIVTEFRADKNSAKGNQLFDAHLEHFFKDEMAARKAAAPKVEKVVKLAEPVAEVEDANSTWTAEEEQALIKAVVKFPGGALQRWEKITDAVNAVGKKSQKEVIRKAKEMESKPPTIDQEAAFHKYLQRMHKDQQGAELSRLRNMTEEDARAFVKEQNEKHEAEQERLANEAAEQERQRLAAEEEKKRVLKAKADEKLRKMQERERLEEERLAAEAKKNDPKKKGGKQSAAAAAPAPQSKKEAAAAPKKEAAAPAAAAADAPEVATSEEWTQEEQERLEKAMQSIAKEVEGRWELIAAEVKTKDKKQCQARFKALREQLKEKAADAPKAQAQNQPKGGAGSKRK